MQRLFTLSVFLLIVVATVGLSSQFVGGEWYQSMRQPRWNPSAVVMVSAWAVSYLLLAVSAWLVWDSSRGLAQVALAWWGLQLLLSIGWFGAFFGIHRVGWSLGVMGLWFLVVLLTIKSFRSIRPGAASLMMPVALWLLFVLLLNFTQWEMNGGGLRSIF